MPPRIHPNGKLVVITGRPAAGKDFISNLLETDPLFSKWQFSRLVTYATRPPRPGEKHGIDHYFISHSELFELEQQNQLVESPILTGSTYKATPKKEFHRVIHQGKKLYWRIDPSLAVKVATGDFFASQFPLIQSRHLQQNTLTIFVDAPKEVLERRRKSRDGAAYSESDYHQRDRYESEILAKHPDVFHAVIQNLDDNLDQTLQQLHQLISTHLS